MKIKSRLLTCMFELGLIAESTNKLLESDLSREQIAELKGAMKQSVNSLMENLALSMELLGIPLDIPKEEPPEEPKRNIFDKNQIIEPEMEE